MRRRKVNVRTKVKKVSRSQITGKTPPRSNPLVAGRTPSRTQIKGKVPEN